MTAILKLMPQEYVHIENTNTCDVITVVGPITFTLYDHHKRLRQHPHTLVVVPPGHYVEVRNPQHLVPHDAASASNSRGNSTHTLPESLLLRSNASTATGIETLRFSRWKSPYGSSELRFHEDSPFALLPDEEVGGILPMTLLMANEALMLEATEAHDTTDPLSGQVRHRQQQEQHLFRGPGYYRPRLDEVVVRQIKGVHVSATDVCYLTALHDFVDEDAAASDDGGSGVQRIAGEQWMLQMEGILFQHPAVDLKVQTKCVIDRTAALMFESTEAFYDAALNVQRVAREPYLVTRADTKDGVYVPRSVERLMTTCRQIHLSATQYCVVGDPVGDDGTRKPRQAEVRVGQRSFIPQPGEKVTRVMNALVLREDEALLLTALQTYTEEAEDEKEMCLGNREATKEPSSQAVSAMVVREGGSRWLVHGPRQYIPPIYARVVERRRVITLDENSGVYVRNIYSGHIRSVFGRPFMLRADEELWARPISAYVRRLLAQPRQSLRVDDMSAEEVAEAAVEEGRANVRRSTGEAELTGDSWSASSAEDEEEEDDSYIESDDDGGEANARDGAGEDPYVSTLDILRNATHNARPRCQSRNIARYHVISANVEHNTLMRLYDTSTGRSRVVAGPAMVYLEPHEHFTPLSLSGGRPKEPHQIHSLSLYLGPDYMADIIEVETRDHARLRLHLAYNWEFDGVEPGSETGVDAQLAFTIPDFVGQACKALASRVRSVIAGQTFEYFHCNSSTLIRQAIFTSAADGSTVVREDSLYFTANGLRVTTVDVQSVEPVDTKTRIALTKSVQLAVEIITKAQESDASHQAALLEQEARGALELQVMRDRARAEAQRTALLRVMGDNTVLEQAGASRAQALAESEARLAEAQGEVDATPIRCAAHAVGMDAELDVLRQRAELDLAHRAAMNELAAEKLRRLSNIEATKYESIMKSLGKDTLIAIANAGPELKAQLLGALGLQGFVVTDGSTPINMLNFAEQITSRSSTA